MKKLLIFILLPLILLIGAGAGAFFMGMIPGLGPGGEPTAAEIEAERKKAEEEQRRREMPPPPFEVSSTEKPIHFQLDEFVVNLRSDRIRPIFMLLSVSVEIPNEGVRADFQEAEARLRDTTIMFLSSKRVEDIRGYSGIEMLRQGLWKRYHEILGPDKMSNIQIMKMTIK